MILSYWVSAYFQGRAVSFSEYIAFLETGWTKDSKTSKGCCLYDFMSWERNVSECIRAKTACSFCTGTTSSNSSIESHGNSGVQPARMGCSIDREFWRRLWACLGTRQCCVASGHEDKLRLCCGECHGVYLFKPSCIFQCAVNLSPPMRCI